MLTQDLGQIHASGLGYDDYVATGTAAQRENWQRIYDQASLTAAQRALLASFSRRMKVLVMSGVWCGDCVQQGPLIARIAEANAGVIDLKWVDRDDVPALRDALAINQGHRVPVAIFMAEDDALVACYGDRTLSRYRAMAAKQLGGACPLPGAPMDGGELACTLQDWLNEFERIHLLLRLSGRLRQMHGD